MFIEKIQEAMFKPINTAAISILGVFSLLWGFWVANPWWTVFDQAEIFEFMTILMPEWLWGAIAIAVGAVMMIGVLYNSYRSLLIGALTGFYFWLFGCINFFLGDWQNTGGITLLMIAIYCGYIALNLRINKKKFLNDQENLALRKNT
jgi:hypothetical protein